MIKDDIQRKLREAVKANDLNGMLIAGPDNVMYAAGVVLPFANQIPDRVAVLFQSASGAQHLVCPAEWADAVRDQGWDGSLTVYAASCGGQPMATAEFTARVMTGAGAVTGKIGLDMRAAPAAFLAALRGHLPGVEWTACDAALADMRMVKTPEEIALLQEAALIADRGFIGALNHLEGTVGSLEYTMAELAERVRVHAYEFDSSGVGHLCAVQGADGRDLYVPASSELVKTGNLVRMDYSHHYLGYWCSAGRMVVTGEPSLAQRRAYEDNLALKRAGTQALKPGVTAGSVFDAVLHAATQSGIIFWEEAGVGHGVGVSEAEAPFLTRGSQTVLSPGMVVALDVWTFGPQGELIHSVDTYEITGGGSRLMSWYKNWDRLYAVTGFRATH